MKQPELITTKSASRCLLVYYHGDQFNEAIEQAERLHGVEGDATVTVICFPMSSKFNDYNKIPRAGKFIKK